MGKPTKVSEGEVVEREWEARNHSGEVVLDRRGRPSIRRAWQYSFVASFADRTKQRHRGQRPSRAEAVEAMEEHKARVLNPPAPPTDSLKVYAENWLKRIAPDVAPKTLRSYKQLFDLYVLPTLGTTPVASITRGGVVKLMDGLRAKNLGKNTARLARAALSALLSDAVEREVVVANVALGAGTKRGRKAAGVNGGKKITPMSVDQLAAFVSAGADDLYVFMADTGVRPGEAYALRWSDLDLDAQTARIERAVSDGELQSTTKTGGTRTVDLTERATERLRVRLADARQEADAEGEDFDDDALVFATAAGNVLDHSNVVRRFRQLLGKAGLPTFRLYDLRHSYATHALAAGAPITYVAAQLGHAKPTMTLSTYAHWLPTSDGRRHVRALELHRHQGSR
jgi:integrase